MFAVGAAVELFRNRYPDGFDQDVIDIKFDAIFSFGPAVGRPPQGKARAGIGRRGNGLGFIDNEIGFHELAHIFSDPCHPNSCAVGQVMTAPADVDVCYVGLELRLQATGRVVGNFYRQFLGRRDRFLRACRRFRVAKPRV